MEGDGEPQKNYVTQQESNLSNFSVSALNSKT